jgi:hypothetical protein
MFTEVSSGVIKSDEGYIVNDHGHFQVTYKEDDHITAFATEPGATTYIYYLNIDVRWQPPHQKEIIPREKQELIKDRIEAALKFRGYKVTIYR